jgi:hypothetical protein
MTGVPVIPSGSMLPQGCVDNATGRPKDRVQSGLPDLASMA